MRHRHLAVMVLVELMVQYQVNNMLEHFQGNQHLLPLHLLLHHNFIVILHHPSLPLAIVILTFSFFVVCQIQLFLFKFVHLPHHILHYLLLTIILIIVLAFIFHLLVFFRILIFRLLHELHLVPIISLDLPNVPILLLILLIFSIFLEVSFLFPAPPTIIALQVELLQLHA